MSDTTITLLGLFGALTLLGVVNIIFGGGNLPDMLSALIGVMGSLVVLPLFFATILMAMIFRYAGFILIGILLYCLLKR